mmetsp:Transcript_33882/g.112090  ORF Transcript_33882/g.112090 Transcript_33882/m.112090 type:complete len:247 (-) Transcript_33882:779-1519(-)
MPSRRQGLLNRGPRLRRCSTARAHAAQAPPIAQRYQRTFARRSYLQPPPSTRSSRRRRPSPESCAPSSAPTAQRHAHAASPTAARRAASPRGWSTRVQLTRCSRSSRRSRRQNSTPRSFACSWLRSTSMRARSASACAQSTAAIARDCTTSCYPRRQTACTLPRMGTHLSTVSSAWSRTCRACSTCCGWLRSTTCSSRAETQICATRCLGAASQRRCGTTRCSCSSSASSTRGSLRARRTSTPWCR